MAAEAPEQRPRILVVDDEPQIVRALKVVLREAGFETVAAETASQALDLAAVHPPEAAIVDLVLPDGDGVEVTRTLRQWSEMPILVLSAVGEEEQKVRALEAGADDYITKPFRIRELTARIRAAVRRRRTPPSAVKAAIRVGVFELHPDRRLAMKRGERIHLTPTEFDLLTVLMTNAGHPIPHAKLLSTVWGAEYGKEREYLRTFILQLRRKLEDDPANPAYLQTVSYLGYVFFDPTKDGDQRR